MASAAIPAELVHRLSACPSTHSQRRRSENGIGSDPRPVDGAMGVYQRAVSEAMMVSGEVDNTGLALTDANARALSTSSFSITHIIDIDDEEAEDDDDEVFHTTARVETLASPNGQYDDLSSFSAVSIAQPSSANLDETSKQNQATQVIISGNNDSSPSSEDTTISDITKVGHQQQSIVHCAAYSSASESLDVSPSGISLLERLVRTHPIWYLPHIGRVAAVHLLRGKSPGVFIVRRSSQPNSMAISIKLPPGSNQDIEHYLIEKTLAGVHLEGSPNYFRELPFLLAYYCENGGELHATLTLPEAILDCESLRDLCSLALLGPEFWTSTHCVSTVERQTDRRGEIGQMRNSSVPPTRLKVESVTVENASTTEITLYDLVNEPDSPTKTQRPPSSHRRSLSVSGWPVAAAEQGRSKLPTVCAGGSTVRKPAPFPNPFNDDIGGPATSSPANAKKTAQKEKSILSKFRSESVSADQKEQQERRNFRLRTLFDVGRRPSVGSSSPVTTRQQSGSLSRNKKTKQAAVTPEMSKKTVASTDITSKEAERTQAVFYVHRRPAPPPPASSPPIPNRQARRAPSAKETAMDKKKIDHEYYYFSPSVGSGNGLNESRSVSSLLHEAVVAEEKQQAAMNTPTMGRRRLLTFRPGSPNGNEDTPVSSSAETTLERPRNVTEMRAASAEERLRSATPVVENRQQSASTRSSGRTFFSSESGSSTFSRATLLRREKSDLGWLPVGKSNRMGGIYATENTTFLKSQHRPAVLPPESKDETFKTCVEELRRRRLESLRQQVASNTNVLHSRRDGSAHVVNVNVAKESALTSPSQKNFTANHSQSSLPTAGVLRAKSTRQQGSGATVSPSHRLSAPNLADAPPGSPGVERRPVVELLREIRSRQQQQQKNAGTLHTINEGLITPMARRRQNVKSKRQAEGGTERRLSQSLEDLPMAVAEHELKADGSSGLENLTKQDGREQRSASYSASSLSTTINQRNEKAFHNETNFQWVAVTHEIRQRQKVARVAPTPNTNLAGKNVESMVDAGSAKMSDYVMLNECADMLCGLSGAQDEVEYSNCRYGSVQRASTNQQDGDMDDARSVVSTAGTVFNEPWDSSAWENLLTLASSMDKNNDGSGNCDSTSSTASSNRPSKVISAEARDQPLAVASKSNGQRQQKSKHQHNKQTAFAWADRLRKLKENNIPPPLAPRWEEFSSCVPMSSDSSLPTSTPTNSLETKRKATTAPLARYDDDSPPMHRRISDHNPNSSTGQHDGTMANQDRFHLSPANGPLRFRTVGAESSRRANRTKKRPTRDPGTRIQECVENLAKDITTFFGAQVQYFIKCTTEGHETDPLIVLGNVRQFMNGLKNYLVKHGECDLHPLIEQERSKLRPTEFLNIDAILEGVLQKIILAPLKPHLYHLLVKEGSSNGSLETLSENIAAVRTRPVAEFGINADSSDSAAMEQVRNCLRRMQYHYSPLKKLEYLLNAVSLAYEASSTSPDGRRSSRNQMPCADELLRWFVYVVCRCSMVGCEMESLYMWNLLHPALLAGEASYYLTAFSSAVHVLKHVDLLPKLNDTCSLSSQVGEGGEGFIKVAVPDEVNGAIRYHSFPIMPQLTAARLCRMIARKCGITNPEDYGLYLLVDGYETCLLSTECPEAVKEHLRATNKAHLFAYKRHEAKIAWPKVAMSPRL